MPALGRFAKIRQLTAFCALYGRTFNMSRHTDSSGSPLQGQGQSKVKNQGQT